MFAAVFNPLVILKLTREHNYEERAALKVNSRSCRRLTPSPEYRRGVIVWLGNWRYVCVRVLYLFSGTCPSDNDAPWCFGYVQGPDQCRRPEVAEHCCHSCAQYVTTPPTTSGTILFCFCHLRTNYTVDWRYHEPKIFLLKIKKIQTRSNTTTYYISTCASVARYKYLN